MPKSRRREQILSAAVAIVEGARRGAQFAPIPGLSAGIDALSDIIAVVEAVKDNNVALDDLVLEATEVVALLSKWITKSKDTRAHEVRESVDELIGVLVRTASSAKEQKVRGGWLSSALLSKSDTKRIEAFREDIKKALNKFMIHSHLEIHDTLSDIAITGEQVTLLPQLVQDFIRHQELYSMRRQDEETRHKYREGVNNEFIQADPESMNSISSSALKELREQSHSGASHDSRARADVPKCLPKTREAVINRIRTWLDGPEDDHQVLWVYGPAGSGKTTIAQSIAEILDELNQLAASFFWSRSAANRPKTSDQFVASIAHQLCIAIPGLVPYVANAMQHDSGIFDRNLTKQLNHLVVGPLNCHAKEYTTFNIQRRWLLLLDGLDECDDDKSQKEIVEIVTDAVRHLAFPLRVLISSRDEHVIRSTLFRSSTDFRPEMLPLSDAYGTEEDIRTLFLTRFDKIREEHPGRAGLSGWPASEVIDMLVHKADRLFIYADHAMKHIEDPDCDPRNGLEDALSVSPTDELPFTQLYAMYALILRRVPAKNVRNVRTILNWLILNGPPSKKSLLLCDTLLSLPPGRSSILLKPLRSVINVTAPPHSDPSSEQSYTLRFYHASFSDFLKDATRLRQHGLEGFHCNPPEAHAELAGLWIDFYNRFGNAVEVTDWINSNRRDWERDIHLNNIFTGIRTHCIALYSGGTPLSDSALIEDLRELDIACLIPDDQINTRVWWSEIDVVLQFLNWLLTVPTQDPYVIAESPCCQRFVDRLQEYWTNTCSSDTRNNIRDILPIDRLTSLHPIFYLSQTNFISQGRLVYAILTGHGLAKLRNICCGYEPLITPDSKGRSSLLLWLIKGWNMHGEDDLGKVGYPPYIRMSDIPGIMKELLPQTYPDVEIGEIMRTSVFIQDKAGAWEGKAVGGVTFPINVAGYGPNISFNDFTLLLKDYLFKVDELTNITNGIDAGLESLVLNPSSGHIPNTFSAQN